MSHLRATALVLALCSSASAAETVKAAELAKDLGHLSLDSQETYRVRDLQLRRGDVSIYLTEGILSFAIPVNGRRVAAVFTTAGVDAGDAEVVVMPPQPAERASLAFFTKSANMDEHFTSAVFFFSDDTSDEVHKKLSGDSVRKAPELAAQLGLEADPVLRGAGAQISTRAVAALLDRHKTAEGFFYAGVAGQTLGALDVLYQPDAFEPVTVGKITRGAQLADRFDSWVSYRPRRAQPYVRPPGAINGYRIETTVQPDLSLTARSEFAFQAPSDAGRTITLNLSNRMIVDSASIDGRPAEVYQSTAPDVRIYNSDAEFLLIAPEPLQAGKEYQIAVQYHGSVIRQTEESYAVTERNLWYPHTETMLTTFDLTFHCAAQFEIVSTGELVSEEVVNGTRTVHRKTADEQQLAGFNLGEYQSRASSNSPYLVTVYADKSAPPDLNGIPDRGAAILNYYTRQWVGLPIRSLAITPVPANFGQGFPGLIYLAKLAYMPEADRPANMRGFRQDTFFSRILLPHELAHEWWGNMITAADYRTEWLMEAMANYAALQFVEQSDPNVGEDPILQQFRSDLNRTVNGKRVEATGPVDFGVRILSTSGFIAWQTIEYEKGAWVLHMLRQRLGDDGFRKMQRALLSEYSGKPVTNEEFREVASSFVPSGLPDKDLKVFFDTWVYGTGIPTLRLNRAEGEVEVSGVDDDFTADLPLRCKAKAGTEQTRWMRIVAGSNPLPSSREPASCQLPSYSNYLYFGQ